LNTTKSLLLALVVGAMLLPAVGRAEDGGVSTDGVTATPIELTLPNLVANRTFTLPDNETLNGLKEGDLLRIGPNDKLEPAPEAKQAADTAAGCLQALRGVAEADTVRAGRLFQALSAPR
jgi:hypothetical protein